ncbi:MULTISPECIES: hypothetical protein [unclassified Candidatus Nanosynbacter]|uniref:hypothetical protein n=1 Tax=unclassified Candidatus Nanosynbacter TaxID=2725944 RepID=UPI001FB5CC60|nr:MULTISPECIES: hypothetical protein [unclassified Candidatus Nanosynbacter]MCJ1963154.1 hypothetical protein [Candidatus Nanosynbacter sp. TM7-033]UOG67644.1 hypothetical protein LRM46_02440 [Candidatus Nanosynbacter sp. HMT-352]
MESKESLDNITNLQNQGEADFSLERKELAMGLVETFSGDHLTPSRKLAAEIIIGMPEDLSRRQRTEYITRSLDGAPEEISKDTVIGIVEDYKVLQEAFLSYMEDIDEGSLAGKALKLKDNQTIPDDLGVDGDNYGKSPWAENPSIPVPHLDNLINVFSTKGERDKGIGLETAMIAGAITLSNLKIAPYHSAFAYKCAVFAENFLIPVCSIIGLDNLESELKDEIGVMTGRNIGDALYRKDALSNDIDSIMNEVDRVVSLHFGSRYSTDPTRFDFAMGNFNGVFSELLGESDLKPAVNTNSSHSTFFGSGTVKTPNGAELEVRARGKGRGSYCKKLLQTIGYYDKRSQPLKDSGEFHPIDLYGMTVICQDNEQLADAYADAVIKAVNGGKITPYPAPGRKSECFVIKGSSDFQEKIRQKIIDKIPDVDMEMFSFKDSSSGFTDAKITGFYATDDGRIPYAPFEMQFSTPDARLVARTDKKAAHFFFKLQKIYGDLVNMSDETAEKVIDIWQRKQDFFTNCADEEKESHLTKQSRERVSEFYKVYNKMNSVSRKIARRAIVSV